MDIIYLYRFIPILFFLHPFILARRKKNKVAQFICGLYLLSAISSLFLSQTYLVWHDFESDTFFGFLTYAIFHMPLLYVSLYIKPFSNLSKINLDSTTIPFIAFLGIGAVYSFVYQLPYALKALSMSAYDVRTSGEALLPSSIFTTIAVGFPMFLFVYVFYFYVSIIKRWSPVISFLMLLGALSFIINVLTVSGRDGFVFFIFAFIMAYFMFEGHLDRGAKYYTKFIAVGAIIVTIVLGATITIDRFGSHAYEDLNAVFQMGVLNYYAMQPFIFNDILKYHDSFSYGRENFPLVYYLFFDYVHEERDLSMPHMYNFSSYVGSFYSNGGFPYVAVVILIFYSVFTRIRSMYAKFYVYQFSLLSFYFFFITSGLFYFRLGNKGGNLFILLSLVMMLLLRKRPVFFQQNS